MSCKHTRTVGQIVPDLVVVIALHTLATFRGARKEDAKPDATETLAERTAGLPQRRLLFFSLDLLCVGGFVGRLFGDYNLSFPVAFL